MPELFSKEEEKSPSEKIEEIKKNASGTEINESLYSITYDSLAEGLEPIYFWILDFMQDPKPSGLGMDEVFKSKDEYEAAVGSGFFSDLGAKTTRMQEQAMKMMATINQVVRSIINLIYDLKEFEIRLDTYNDIKSNDKDKIESAEIALRVLWMDQVDIKRGRGSINMLSRELQFVTLRDAFIYAKSEEDVNNLDLNDRVKRILKARLNEYFKWKEYSEKELRKRYNIEKAYLKSQLNSLKHYTAWVKPYLIAAKKLGMSNFLRSGMQNPNIVNLFNNVEIHLTILGKKRIQPIEINEEYANLQLGTYYNSCVEMEIIFRTVPRATQTQQGLVYLHSGKTQINFRAYSFKDNELDEISKLQAEEDFELIEGMTEVSLKEIQEDIEHFLGKPEEEEEKKKKVKYPNPFSGITKGFKQTIGPLKNVYSTLRFKNPVLDKSFQEKKIREYCLNDAKAKCYVMYDIYKKSHGMFAW